MASDVSPVSNPAVHASETVSLTLRLLLLFILLAIQFAIAVYSIFHRSIHIPVQELISATLF